MDALKQNAGFSLPEFLVATLMASLTLTSLVSFTAGGARVFRHIDGCLAANQTLRLVLDVLTRDLRQAGFDPLGTAVQPLAAAGPTALVLQQDANGDGLIDRTSSEVVTYVFRPASGILSRVVGRQSMPLATGLPADGFRLSYLDAMGTRLGLDAGELDDAGRDAVRRVRVALMFRDASGAPYVSALTEVALRNRPWTP